MTNATTATATNAIPKTFAELASRPFEDLLAWAKDDGHKFTKPPTRNKLLTLLCAPRKIKIPAGYFETEKAKQAATSTNPADDLRHATDTDDTPAKTTKQPKAKETKETEPKARTFRGQWLKPEGNKRTPIYQMEQGDYLTTPGGANIYQMTKKETNETGELIAIELTKQGFEQTKHGHRAETYRLETFGIDGNFALSIKAHWGYGAIKLKPAETEKA